MFDFLFSIYGLTVFLIGIIIGLFVGAIAYHYDMINHPHHKKYFDKYKEKQKWNRT